jgi:hypothetical protein
VFDYRTIHPCVECGESRPWCLDFDHRNPSNKKFEISKLVDHGSSLDKLVTEIEKCDVRCANCHRDRHHKFLLTSM